MRWVLSMILLCSTVAGGASDETAGLIDQAIAGAHRTPENIHRHPKETLLFFGVEPHHHIVEITPGGGWYTEVLAPLARDKGRYYAAQFALEEGAPGYQRRVRDNFLAKLARNPAVYDNVVVTAFEPHRLGAIAPAGAADIVLTFRNVHNWTQQGTDAASFAAFFSVLKPGGVLGVVEHRAKEGTSVADMTRTGYMTESYVVRLAEQAGFRLLARSEINANARDTKDHPRGVWSLPPTLAGGNEDRARLSTIGESDRMTLKFVKPR